MSNSRTSVQNLISSAAVAGTISAATSSLLSGNLGAVVIAGAAGKDAEDIVASDVTLVTLLVDASSSIHDRQLEDAIREGQNLLVDALGDTRERESIPTALWTFNHDLNVVHSYVGLDDVTRLDAKNYAGLGATRLYDTWCGALTANVAYAQRLRGSGTPLQERGRRHHRRRGLRLEACVAVQASATPSAIRQVFRMVSQSAIRASQGRIAPGPNAGFFTP